MRIWAISDIHVDFRENAEWISALSEEEFRQDVCLLAGDVSHQFDMLTRTLVQLRRKFDRLFFVPGNHDLWIRGEHWEHSVEKFEAILQFCRENGIDTQPALIEVQGKRVCLYPVFSWYHQPPQQNSLFLPKPGEDSSNRMWSDTYFVRWPAPDFDPADYFIRRSNSSVFSQKPDLVVTFSHFLPRQEIMFRGPMTYDPERMKKYDRFPQFNFSRVAGSWQIDRFIRRVGAAIHVYGHQHINRDRTIDGVRYIAHCLGYPEERRRGTVQGIDQGLKQVV